MGDDGLATNDLLSSSAYIYQQTHSIRHISGIFVRNLTPFPQRDQVVSALEHNLFATNLSSRRDAHAVTSDDLDITLSRKCQRRTSSTSIATFPGRTSEALAAGSPDADSAVKARRPSTSKPTPAASQHSSWRGRSSSNDASHYDTASFVGSARSGGFSSTSTLSQRNLELVVSSRLFETFLTLSDVSPSSFALEGAFARSSRARTTSASASRLRGLLEPQDLTRSKGSQGDSTLACGFSSTSSSAVKSPTERLRLDYHRTASLSSLETINSPISSPPSTPRSADSKPPPDTPPATSSRISGSSTLQPQIPFYISDIRSPSTNPRWEDIDPLTDFTSPRSDLKNRFVQVTLWARRPSSISTSSPFTPSTATNPQGKEREEDAWSGFEDPSEWSKITSWDIDMTQLQPLAPDFVSISADLPPNSLVLKLATTGFLYHAPSRCSRTRVSRSPSPEHNVSDGEVDAVKAGVASSRGRRRQFEAARSEVQRRSRRETKMKQGATLDDSLRILDLQTIVAEAEQSLDHVIRAVDQLVTEDGLLGMLRELDEAAASLEDIRQTTAKSFQSHSKLKAVIRNRRAEVKQRRAGLVEAMGLFNDELQTFKAWQLDIDTQQSELITSKALLTSARACIVRSLERIFPIEPLSPPDLLFSILSVPLPIPTHPSDPAPPLNATFDLSSSSISDLPGTLNHPRNISVTEDGVASALGYVAQLVHMISVYLGHYIPYPITCAGSRSIVKDPISTMHGPRTFPLYSKGVDTYRFEYGVFLLNKDIETLMTQQGLQTLDMRHTLPNLKNLILTLTSGLSDEDDDFGAFKMQSEHINITVDAGAQKPNLPNGLSFPPVISISTQSISETTDDGDAPTTPTASHPHRKPFFAPITDLWSRRAASGSAISPVLASPSLATMTDLNASEEADASSTSCPTSTTTSDLSDSNKEGQSLLATDVPASSASPYPLERDSGGEGSTPTPPSNTASDNVPAMEEDEVGDTETIKDGSVGRSSTAQSGWLTKAFFGQQIERDRDRDKEKVGVRRRHVRSIAESLSS